DRDGAASHRPRRAAVWRQRRAHRRQGRGALSRDPRAAHLRGRERGAEAHRRARDAQAARHEGEGGGGMSTLRAQARKDAAGTEMLQVDVADGVATVTLARPPVNAISEAWVAAFQSTLDKLLVPGGWTVLHLRSGQKVFCAGADLKEVRARIDAPDGADRMYAYVAGIQRLYARIERLSQVTIAEIGGAAMGGGLELALACDLRIAAVEAKLGLP